MQQAAYKRKEVAQLLGLGLRTLEEWAQHRKGPPFVKYGRAVRYPVEWVQAFRRGEQVPWPSQTQRAA